MNKEHIVVTGCSISSDVTSIDTDDHKFYSYPFWLERNQFKVTNLSQSGFDNGTISRLTIHEVSQLLKGGMNPDDIFVLIQWSGIDRASSFVTKDETIDYDDLWKFNFIQDTSDKGWAVNRGKSDSVVFWEDYRNLLYTEEGFFIKTLEDILRTQWFLKSVGVRYKMFTGWDIFTFNTGKSGGYGTNHESGGQFLTDKIYVNKFNELLKDTFTNSTYLWNLIDFDNFWTFNNHLIKFGGIIQWVEHTFDKTDKYFRGGHPFDFHPNDSAHKEFCNKVLIPLIEESRK